MASELSMAPSESGHARPAPPWRSWTVAQWSQHRAAYAAHLLIDPDHKPTAAVIRLCDWHIDRLENAA